MPEIKIHKDPVLQVAEIISVMAYPSDKSARHELERKVAFSMYLDLREKLLDHDVRDRLLAEGKVDTEYVKCIDEICLVMCAELAPMLLDSDSYEASLKKAFPDVAFLVGQNVLQMFKFQSIDNTFVGRNRASHFIADNLVNTSSKFSPKTLDKAWPKYKSVAHFWAAYAFFTVREQHNGIFGTSIFLVHYKEILGLAIFFQEFLLSYKSSNNRKIEFDLSKVWKTPEGAGIEIFDLKTACSEEKEREIRKWNNNYFNKAK